MDMIQSCMEQYKKDHGYFPRNITISWSMFQHMLDEHFVREWQVTMLNHDCAIITDIGNTNVWVNKNQKESIVVGG